MNHTTQTIAFILATMGAYVISRIASKRYPLPFTTPVFFSTVVVIALLALSQSSVADYDDAKYVMTYFLGAATVALTVPLYKNRRVLLDNGAPVIAGLVVGSATTMVTAVLMAKTLGLGEIVVSSISTKSITAAIAIDVARMIHADPSLAAVFSVITGMLGAMMGPLILSKSGIHDPLARGLSLGVVSHGQGTAQALTEGQLQGASGGIAMGLMAICAPLMVPVVLKVFG